jgi:predicted nucleotidyltransferase
MFPTPFPELNHVLGKLVSGLEQMLSGRFVGVYLLGSLALRDFDEHSDVDFIVALEGRLSSSDVDSLQVMHGLLFDLGPEWARHLEGSYFPRAILKSKSKIPERLGCLDNGARALVRFDHCNTLLVRCVLRESGVTLTGPLQESSSIR